MSRLLIVMSRPRTPPGKCRDRDMLLADRIRSGGIGDVLDGNGARRGGHPPVTVHQPHSNPNSSNLPDQLLPRCRQASSDRGNESRHLTVLTANPAWGGGGAR